MSREQRISIFVNPLLPLTTEVYEKKWKVASSKSEHFCDGWCDKFMIKLDNQSSYFKTPEVGIVGISVQLLM